MDSLNIMQNIKPGEFLCFAVYDNRSKLLLYSKYNFDFNKYSEDKNYIGYTKNQIFYDFLVENETDLTKPFILKDSLKDYFTPITQDIRRYFDDYNYILYGFNNNYITTYITKNTIMENEFTTFLYDYFTEIPNICVFLHIDENGFYFTKYNFNELFKKI